MSPALRCCLARAPPSIQVSPTTSPRLTAGMLAGPHQTPALQTLLKMQATAVFPNPTPFFLPHLLISFKSFSTEQTPLGWLMLFEGFLNHRTITNYYYYFAAAIRDTGLINKLAPLVSLETRSCQATAALRPQAMLLQRLQLIPRKMLGSGTV